MTQRCPFRYFKTSPEIIRLAVMMYIRFPLSLRNVEDLLHEGEVFLVTEGSENNARDKNCHEHHRADTLAWVLNT